MEDSEKKAASQTGSKARKTTKRAATTTRPPRARTKKAPKAATATDVGATPELDLAPPAPPAAVEAPPAPVEAVPAPAPEPASEAMPAQAREIFTPSDRTSEPAALEKVESATREEPAAVAVPAPEAPAATPAPTHGGPDGGKGDRKPWWERKKDKKKQKWLEKQASREGRHPAQPPPPALQPTYGDLPDPARFADTAALDAQAVEISSGHGEPVQLQQLYAFNLSDLSAYARKLGVALEGVPSRKQWLEAVFKFAADQKRPITDRGWIDLTDKGHGFIVHEHVNYRLYPEDAYLPESLIKRYGLKRGHLVETLALPPQAGERCPAVISVRSVMGTAPDKIAAVTPFEELTPYYPLKRILLEAPEIHKDISMRAVDLLTPVGFGQRGLLVAPPRTGKTVLLQNIANSISNNFPDVKLILLLVDERPEEVTDFKRHTRGEVVSSTFDEAPESHVHAAEMVIEKARRLVEMGQHVVILLDSITRLARAYNALASNSGKIMSGGVEATALQKPKRFFGSARNIEGGGSLTILGTALIDTGSRMDEVIFEEFKGTGNMELHLDRGLSDKRIFPAINIDRSGTRKEELIYHPDEMLRVYGLRRAMQGIPPVEAMEMFITRLKKTKSNAEFLMSLNR
ncbi:MAG TPA: transcription termination factor Rho [Opitutaceae bacterium]